MKRPYFVRFQFTATVEAESDADALMSAACSLKYGVDKVRRLQLEVSGVGPLPVQTPAPIEVPTADQPTVPAPVYDGNPF